MRSVIGGFFGPPDSDAIPGMYGDANHKRFQSPAVRSVLRAIPVTFRLRL